MKTGVIQPEVMKLAKKLIVIGMGIGYLQKDAKNPHHGYKYASEKTIKEAFYHRLHEAGVLFWVETDGVNTQLLDKALIVPGTFHFLDTEGGGYLEGSLAGAGRGGDDKGVYIATTGIIKYCLTTIGGIVTGDDAEKDDHTVEATAPTEERSPPSVQPTEPSGIARPDLQPSDVLLCPDCGFKTVYGDINDMPSKWRDSKGRWGVDKWVYYCPGCPEGPKGGKKVMSVALALNTAIKQQKGDDSATPY